MTTTFDLTLLRDFPPNRNARWLRIVSAVALVLGALLLAFDGLVWASTGSWNGAKVAVAGLGILVLMMFAFMFRVARPPADYLDLNAEGLSLRSRKGRLLFIGWSEPSLDLMLSETEGAPDNISRGGPAFRLLAKNRRLRLYLTKEAFHAILDQARAVGLLTSTTASPSPGWIRYVITARRESGSTLSRTP